MNVKKWWVFIISFLIVAVILATMNIPIAGVLSILAWLFEDVHSARVVLKYALYGLLIIELIPVGIYLYRKVRNERLD